MTIQTNSHDGVARSRAGLRMLLTSGLATVFAASLIGSASANDDRFFSGPALTKARQTQATPVSLKRRHARSRHWQSAEPKSKNGPEKLQGPLELVISIRSQKITLYANGEPAGTSIISTGVPGHATPMGVFSVIEKDRYHHSNIYSGAPMPYMQRITWSGVALHQGMVTGHPASHGCIRLPQAFAQRLWGITQVGVRVIIAPEDVSPVAITDERLFAMKQKPGVSPVAERAPDPVPAAKIRLATNAEVTDSPTLPASTEQAPAAQPAAVEPIVTQPAAVAETPAAQPAASAPETTQSTATEPPTPESIAAELATTPPTFNEPATTASTTPEPTATQQTTAEPAPAQSTAAEPAANVAPVADGATVTDLIRGTVAKETAEKAKEIEAAQAAERATEIANAKSPDVEKSKPVATAKQYPERPGAITVFISRSLGKLFVRRGFWPVFDTPVKIAQPERPFGTHVFTALEPKDDKGALRWNVVTLPNASTVSTQPLTRAQRKAGMAAPQPTRASGVNPSEVLGRITIPDEALERITEMMTPGASLIISDLGMSGETVRGTDFIIVTR